MLSNTGVLQKTVAEICHEEVLACPYQAMASTWQSYTTLGPHCQMVYMCTNNDKL